MTPLGKRAGVGFLRAALSGLLGLALGLCVTWIAGEKPWVVLRILAQSAFGSRYDFGLTLFYATPLIFTGLSVAVAFRAGLFNVGAEGQLTVGALALAAAGILMPNLPAPAAMVAAILAALTAGALWGAIPACLKTRRGSHEVITTIMLNFIAAGVTSYLTLSWLRNPESQNPETRAVGPGYLITQFSWFNGAPVSAALVGAVLCSVLVWWLLKYTALGFQMRAAGQGERAAELAGIPVAARQILALTLAGGLAGLAGVGDILGNTGKFRVGFSPEYGFLGIAVALLAQNHPLGVLPAALFFGALHKGTGDLDLETEHVTREVSLIFQGMILLMVSCRGLWEGLARWAAHPPPKPDFTRSAKPH